MFFFTVQEAPQGREREKKKELKYSTYKKIIEINDMNRDWFLIKSYSNISPLKKFRDKMQIKKGCPKVYQ